MRIFPLLALFLFSLPVTAQGIVLTNVGVEPRPSTVRPRPRPRPRPTRLPMRLIEHRVRIVIEDQIARTEVVQIFENPNATPIEGVYLFPLPAGAAVSDFTMSMAGKQVTGEILDARRASEIYRSIVRRRDDPGLLEYAGRRLIRARLFPIPARGKTTVTLAFSHVLVAQAGLVEMSYPLRTSAFDRGVVKMSGEIVVRSKHGVANIFSPSHKLDVSRRNDGHWVTSFEETGRANRDLEFLYALGNREFGVSLVTHQPAGDDGYFLLLVSPRTSGKPKTILPKDVVFVLDTSGSMGDRGGLKMKQVKRAMGYALGRLRPEDRFNIVSFSTEARAFRDDLILATEENVRAAVAHVDGLVATGGTAIHDALVRALSHKRAEGRVPVVIFLTDGQPTIGPVEPAKILEAARKANASDARVFVFGVGYDVNVNLLTDLADAERGSTSFVTEQESIERKVSSLVDRISSPVLTDAVVTISGLETFDVYPKRVGDLFDGQQVVLSGRFKSNRNLDVTAAAIRLEGKLGTESVKFVYEANFNGKPGREFVSQLWAVRRVGFLLGEIRRNGQSKELVDEIRKLGTRFGIVTPYTSFLVVDERELTRARLGGVAGSPATPRDRRRLERKMADLAEEEADASGAADSLDRGMTSGRGAFAGGKKQVELNKASRPGGVTGRGVRRVSGKTFRWTKGAWCDLASDGHGDGARKEVVYLSDEYMTLLKSDAIARWFSLGKEVRFVHDSTLYIVKRR